MGESLSTLEFYLLFDDPNTPLRDTLRHRSRPSEKSVPSPGMERLGKAHSVMTNVASTTKTLVTSGEACMEFLERFKVFVDIVDQVAAVRFPTQLAHYMC